MLPMYADWIRNVYEANEHGKVFASERKPLGVLIKNLLRNQPKEFKPRHVERGKFVEFILPDYSEIDTSHKNYISENSERVIQGKIRSLFYYDLNDFVIEMSNNGVKEVRRIISLWCEQREISEDHFKINTLERERRRTLAKQKNFQNTRKMASVFALFLSFMLPLFVPFTSLIIN